MNGIDLRDDDVLSFPKYVKSWKLGTNKAKAVLDEIKEIPASHRDGGELIVHLWSEGADCEYLSVNGGGWRKGKLKMHIKFEFIPDEQPEETTVTPSPLDDLRTELNLDNQ